jgi:hypothetical protein
MSQPQFVCYERTKNMNLIVHSQHKFRPGAKRCERCNCILKCTYKDCTRIAIGHIVPPVCSHCYDYYLWDLD